MTTQEKQHCGLSKDFNYCFWAKVLVGIPVLPLAAILVASQFETQAAMGFAAVGTVIGLIALSRWIDRIPALTKKIRS